MSECPIHRVELLLGRCWMCRGVPPGGTPNRPHCLVHDEGLPLQTCTCGAASRSEQSAPSGVAVLVDGAIVIRVPVAGLAAAVRQSCDGGHIGPPLIEISNEAAFAKAMVLELNREREDGETPITLMLDAAVIAAAECGADGCEVIDDAE
jgi:hypothetical protein